MSLPVPFADLASGWSQAHFVRAFELLLGWSLLLQTLEQWRIQGLDRVSDWSVQRREMPAHPPGLRALTDALFSRPGPYLAMLGLRGLLALALMAGVLPAAGAVALFVIALLLLLRWRGAFNGGSDFMTLVGLTGLLIAHAVGAWSGMEAGWRAGLWYVALQSLTSYFVSGWVKFLRPEWRSGEALPLFWTRASTARSHRAACFVVRWWHERRPGPSPSGKAARRWCCWTCASPRSIARWRRCSTSWCSGSSV